MLLDLTATVVDRDGKKVGELNEVAFERESRRIAGFLVRTNEGVPREVFIRAGQAARIERDLITLTLTAANFQALPDAREHLYVEPDDDLTAELDAEDEAHTATTPDPDEQPRFSAALGIPVTPNMLIPIEIERTLLADDQVAFSDRLRIIAADGAEVGQLGGVVVNDEAQLAGLIVAYTGHVVDYGLIERLDEDAGEIVLTAYNPETGQLEDDEAAGQASAGQTMIATLVLFYDGERRWTHDALVAAFEGSAPLYRSMDGLRSKAYVIDPERNEFGGFYLWESREQMTRVQGTEDWLRSVRERYGITPTIRVFEAPVTVDNAAPAAGVPNASKAAVDVAGGAVE
jgi:sporulation protein YlmC with PRC-barrel domain